MQRESLPDIEQLIVGKLKREDKDFLTAKQLLDTLPEGAKKAMGVPSKITSSELQKKLQPFLGEDLHFFRGARNSLYTGFKISPEELVLRKIRRSHSVSLGKLPQGFALSKKSCIAAVNALLRSRVVECTFGENGTPWLRIAGDDPAVEPAARAKKGPVASAGASPALESRTSSPSMTSGSPGAPPSAAERSDFHAAYDIVGKGRSFVRIHRIREHLGWPRERFDRVLAGLMADFSVELHGGDPSSMSEEELRGSFEDQKGMLYIAMTWRA